MKAIDSKKSIHQTEYTFEIKHSLKKYIIKLINDIKNNKIKIFISIDNINLIVHQKAFEFKDFEIYDNNFFFPFKNNNILFKFLIRLFSANLADIKLENDNIYLILICLKDNNINYIKIFIPKASNINDKYQSNTSNECQNISNDNIQNINNSQKNDEENKNYDAPNPLDNMNNINNTNIIYYKPFKNKDKEYTIKITKIEHEIQNYKNYKEI